MPFFILKIECQFDFIFLKNKFRGVARKRAPIHGACGVVGNWSDRTPRRVVGKTKSNWHYPRFIRHFMRKTLIAGNWKMHGSKKEAHALVEGIKRGIKQDISTDVLILPPFPYLSEINNLLGGTALLLGAQNLYLGEQGAFTGEVSGPMLAEMGCQYVLVGHSERRSLFQEDLSLVAAKFKAAQEAKLIPILCVGETKKEREEGKTESIIQKQLESVLELVGLSAFQQAVIAYEPVWAIGTGLTATPDQAEVVHAFIRSLISKIQVDLAKTIRILYGGSMKPENAQALLAMPDIDGGLIGGASLEVESFLNICKAASEKSRV